MTKEYINQKIKEVIEVRRNWDKSIGLGLDVYFHRHTEDSKIHFHICITFIAWFVEMQIGKEY